MIRFAKSFHPGERAGCFDKTTAVDLEASMLLCSIRKGGALGAKGPVDVARSSSGWLYGSSPGLISSISQILYRSMAHDGSKVVESLYARDHVFPH